MIYPDINRHTGKLGKGTNLAENQEFNKSLKQHRLPMPATDIENELKYYEALNKFIRPAKTMFAGSFSEVRDFNERLNRTMDSNLFIFSTRYGLIPSNQNIIPYQTNPFTPQLLNLINKKHDILRKMTKISSDADFVILLLPSTCIQYIIIENWLNDLPSYVKIIAVTSPNFESSFNLKKTTILKRVGVARIGKKNREKILATLEGN